MLTFSTQITSHIFHNIELAPNSSNLESATLKKFLEYASKAVHPGKLLS